MSKYIIKNCPACTINPNCCAKYYIDNGRTKDCQDVTDCILKQIVEKCKKYIENYNDKVFMIKMMCKSLWEKLCYLSQYYVRF